MEPTPPKGSRLTKKFNRPFYEASRKTSAEIVAEARSSLRTFDTKRPFTPAETNRTLFSGIGKQDGRPPSAISGLGLSYNESRPTTTTGRKLSPIDTGIADLKDLEKRLKSVSAGKYRRGRSLETVYDENNNESETLYTSESTLPFRNGETNRYSTNDIKKVDKTRVSSGPKERTAQIQYEILKQRSNSSGDISAKNNIQKDESSEQRNESSEKSKKSRENATYFNNFIKPLLGQMELNKLHEDEDALIVNFDILWKTLEIGNMLGKSKLGSKRRSELLSSIYKCTSGENVVLLLKLAKLFLTLEVTGKNLEAVCKLLLKVSRDKKHDDLFLSEGLIELLSNLLKSPQNLEAANLVYLTGTIKFLSMNNTMLGEMVKYDMLHSISTLLRYTVNECTSDSIRNKESCHMLVQVTSMLVNVVSDSTLKNKFLSYSILQQLIDLTETRYTDSDYFLNVSRLLSKLTMDAGACHEISRSTNNYRILFEALKYNYKKANISVRVCYSLGNIANYCIDKRQCLAFEFNGIGLILEIAEYYLDSLVEKVDVTKDIDDVLVKLIRIIANLSIDENCGIGFSNNENCNKVLCRVMDINEKKCLSDELLVSCATTLNNLSYYADDDSVLMRNQQHYALGMIDMLLSKNINCVVEAMRVLGNFTRSKMVCDILMNEEVFEVVVNLIDSNNTDVIFSTCGILINVMIDEGNRFHFKKFHGITKLIRILKEFAEMDWLLGGLVCQILWNFSEKIVTASECFGDNDTDDLITILNELTEPELALDYESHEDIDDKARKILEDTWSKHFHPVASQLLKRIDRHHSDLVPIITFPE